MRVTVRDPSKNVNHVSNVVGYRKIIIEFTRSLSSTKIGYPVLMMDAEVSRDKYISTWVN